jgi:hypothetical protein
MTFMVGMTVVAAALYNVLASRWGGVRIFVSDGPDAATVTGSAATTAHNGSGKGAAARGNRMKRVSVGRAPAPRVRSRRRRRP